MVLFHNLRRKPYILDQPKQRRHRRVGARPNRKGHPTGKVAGTGEKKKKQKRKKRDHKNVGTSSSHDTPPEPIRPTHARLLSDIAVLDYLEYAAYHDEVNFDETGENNMDIFDSASHGESSSVATSSRSIGTGSMDDTSHTMEWMANGVKQEYQDSKPSLTDDYNPDELGWFLRLTFIHIVSYLCVAVLIYSFWLEPTWTVIDSLYFATNLFTTVGQSDQEPSTPLGQLMTVFLSVYGVIVLGVFIGIIGYSVSEGQARVTKRIKAKTRKTILHKLVLSNAEEQQEMDGNACTKANPANTPLAGTQTPLCPPKSRALPPAAIVNTFADDFRALLKDIQYVLGAELPEIMVVALFAFILGYREGWSIVSILYFCIMTASTTGFGDFVPHSQLNKLYCVLFLPLAVAVFGEVLGRIASVYVQRKARAKEAALLQRSITLCDLRRMDSNQDGCVDMEEFLTFMLVALQKVEPQLLDDLKATFHALDNNGNGLLDKDDLVELEDTGWTEWKRRNSTIET